MLGAGPDPRRVLVGTAVGVGRLRHRSGAAVTPRRRASATGALPASSPSPWRRRLACGCSITAAGPPCARGHGPEHRHGPDCMASAGGRGHGPMRCRSGVQDLVEWRVLVLGVTLFLYSFSYGGITSFAALHAEQQGVEPRAIYFTAFCHRDHLHAAVHRPLCRRGGPPEGHHPVPDGGGCRRRLAVDGRRPGPGSWSRPSVFGTGFGSVYPIFVAHLMKKVDNHAAARRRSAR